jgi:hypothetical protein
MKDMPRKPMPTPQVDTHPKKKFSQHLMQQILRQIPKSYDEVVAANQAATKGANNAEGPKRVFSEYCFMEMRGSTWVTGTKEVGESDELRLP